MYAQDVYTHYNLHEYMCLPDTYMQNCSACMYLENSKPRIIYKHALVLRSDLYRDTGDNATSLPILKAGPANVHVVS